MRAALRDVQSLCAADSPAWVRTGEKRGVAYFKPADGGVGCKGEGVLPFPPRAVVALLRDVGARGRYDSQFDSGRVVKTLGYQTNATYLRFKGVGFVAGRDFLIAAHWRLAADGAWWLATRSIEEALVVGRGGARLGTGSHVRGSVLVGGWAVRPEAGGARARVTYVQRSDLGGSLPATVSAFVTQQQAALVETLGRALALEYGGGAPAAFDALPPLANETLEAWEGKGGAGGAAQEAWEGKGGAGGAAQEAWEAKSGGGGDGGSAAAAAAAAARAPGAPPTPAAAPPPPPPPPPPAPPLAAPEAAWPPPPPPPPAAPSGGEGAPAAPPPPLRPLLSPLAAPAALAAAHAVLAGTALLALLCVGAGAWLADAPGRGLLLRWFFSALAGGALLALHSPLPLPLPLPLPARAGGAAAAAAAAAALLALACPLPGAPRGAAAAAARALAAPAARALLGAEGAATAGGAGETAAMLQAAALLAVALRRVRPGRGAMEAAAGACARPAREAARRWGAPGAGAP